MVKSLYDAVTEVISVNFNSHGTEELKEKINLRKADLWKVFLNYRNNPVVREVIEGNSTFTVQLDDIINSYNKNTIALNKKMIALNECLGLNFPHSLEVYVLGFGLLGAAVFGYLAPKKSDSEPNPSEVDDSNPGKVNHSKRAFVKKTPAIPLIVGGSIGGVLGYGNYSVQRVALSERALYLDRIYRLVR